MTAGADVRRRVARDRRWLQLEGFGRVLEEKDLSTESFRSVVARQRWKVRHAGSDRPTVVWIVGLQRSGTNMLVRALRTAPEVQVHNEGDRRAFRDYRLRDEATLRRLIGRARADAVAFKPLCDSHRVADLLDDPVLAPGRALWVYRSVDARVRSAVARFGTTARDALAEVARGE